VGLVVVVELGLDGKVVHLSFRTFGRGRSYFFLRGLPTPRVRGAEVRGVA